MIRQLGERLSVPFAHPALLLSKALQARVDSLARATQLLCGFDRCSSSIKQRE
jgi:hypothetical protein